MDFYTIVLISIIIFICFIMFFKKKESYSRFLEEPFSIVHNIDSNVWCTPIEIEEREIGMDRMSGWF